MLSFVSFFPFYLDKTFQLLFVAIQLQIHHRKCLRLSCNVLKNDITSTNNICFTSTSLDKNLSAAFSNLVLFSTCFLFILRWSWTVSQWDERLEMYCLLAIYSLLKKKTDSKQSNRLSNIIGIFGISYPIIFLDNDI